MQTLPAVVPQEPRPLMERMASRFGIDETKLMTTLKATAFKVRDGQVTNEQMTALLIVADQYGLNPFTKELYAYPDKGGGIVPVVSVDGWARIINEHPKFDGMDFEFSESKVKLKGGKDSPEWCKCRLHRKDRAHPTAIIEYLDEVFRDLSYTNPWQTHTKRMLRHKALIQCARITFGFAGIYDQDEAERIIEMDVTPITPTSGYLSELKGDRQEVVIATANEVKALLADGKEMDAYAMWKDSKFEAEETIAFWGLFGGKQFSAQRATLKRMEAAEHAQDKGTISPAQHKRLEARIKEIGADRGALKDWCMAKFGVEHFTQLTKDDYKTLDVHLDQQPKAAPTGESTNRKPVADGEGPAGAAPSAKPASPQLNAIIAAIEDVRGQKSAANVADMIKLLSDEAERKYATESLEWQVGELKKQSKGAL